MAMFNSYVSHNQRLPVAPVGGVNNIGGTGDLDPGYLWI